MAIQGENRDEPAHLKSVVCCHWATATSQSPVERRRLHACRTLVAPVLAGLPGRVARPSVNRARDLWDPPMRADAAPARAALHIEATHAPKCCCLSARYRR